MPNQTMLCLATDYTQNDTEDDPRLNMHVELNSFINV